MTNEQQNSLIYGILRFTMPDGSSISPDAKAGTIIAALGLPDLPQLRRLIAIGAGRTEHHMRRKQAKIDRGEYHLSAKELEALSA